MSSAVRTLSPDDETEEEKQLMKKWNSTSFFSKLAWRNIILLTLLHPAALYGLYLGVVSVKWSTIIYSSLIGYWSGFGITAGAHRLWTHRTYKAKLPLRIFLALANTIAFQTPLYVWARDHRVHHAFSETDADPHNANRGFFFSHMGWLMLKKHPYVTTRGRKIDLSDLKADPVVMLQYMLYIPVVVPVSFFLPPLLVSYWSGDPYWNCFFVSLTRYVIILHSTWLVNSAAHLYGNKPYDRYIGPVENKWVAFFAVGEGWHNYHHVFPQDYKTSELGGYKLNITTMFIDAMAWLGQAYDLKTVPDHVITGRAERTGDGSHKPQESHYQNNNTVISKSKSNIDTSTAKSMSNIDTSTAKSL